VKPADEAVLAAVQAGAVTVREVAAAAGLSTGGAHKALWRLRREGYVIWSDFAKRTLRILEDA
jgi:DNA-binding IclR family transcriptional regulator